LKTSELSTRRKKMPWGRIALQTLLLLLAVLMAFPFFYLFKLSVQPDADVRELPIKFLPSKLMFINYMRVIEQFPILQQFWNTVFYATCTTTLTILTGALASYALAKLSLPGSRWLTLFFISSMLLPPEMRAVPMFSMMASFKWVDTWQGMILPLASTGFTIFFIYQFMITIPFELLDASRIDGASENTILWKIIMPLSKTALGTMALYNFLFRWRDFIWPLFMTKGNVTTLSVGLSAFKTGERLMPWNLIGTASMFLFLPSLFLFLGLRRYIMQAVSTEFK
jgi:ABC-type glycerol-3-phosphate transport system permease component